MYGQTQQPCQPANLKGRQGTLPLGYQYGHGMELATRDRGLLMSTLLLRTGSKRKCSEFKEERPARHLCHVTHTKYTRELQQGWATVRPWSLIAG